MGFPVRSIIYFPRQGGLPPVDHVCCKSDVCTRESCSQSILA